MPVIPTSQPIRIPEARVLKALMPDDPLEHWGEWPMLDRLTLAERAGFVPTTGTINRVLNGIPPNSSSGKPHKGLLERGLLKLTVVYVGNIKENHYRITAAGIKELQRFLEQQSIPERRDKESCTNHRYTGTIQDAQT